MEIDNKKISPNFYRRVGLVKAQIIPDRIENDVTYESYIKELSTMLLNPESWSDNKSANWIKHQVPGRSDPIQQWMASGVRTITFDALVTRDLSGDSGVPKERTQAAKPSTISKGDIFTRVGNIGRQIFNIPEISIADWKSTENPLSFSDLLSITNTLDFYRSLVYPVVLGNRIQSPRTVQLKVGSTLGKRNGLGDAKFVVEKIEIKITKQYPNLSPIEAIVSFNLSEIVDQVIISNNVV
jgi:hypothetical protein